ncbi:MAG: DUF1351 domain-containing protein [Eubacterium sp.]|nr:DUF1351 domain-containing protein [Eubacterium sp.]
MAEKEIVIETTGEVVESVDILDTTGLIEVTQLPVIVERLYQIKETVTDRVESALALECTEDSKKQIKDERAALNKMFKELEEKRKEVKAKVLKPYEDFENLYKECVTNIFKPADTQLRDKIAAVEDDQKEQKRQKALAYFEEYRESLGIDFVSFEDVGLNITLNVTDKKLKTACKDFLDRIKEGLDLIATQEHPEEILVEYKETLNAASAITVVKNRYQRIEEEKQRRAEAEARAKAEAEHQAEIERAIAEASSEDEDEPSFEDHFVAPTANDISELSAPTAEPVTEDTSEKPDVYEVTFTVKGTIDDLRAMKQLFNERGMTYVQL